MRAASVLRTLLWALIGTLATAAVAVYAFATTYLPGRTNDRVLASPFGWVRSPATQEWSFWACLVAGPVLFLAWLALRPRAGRRTPVLPITAVWLAPLLLTGPVLTADPFAYAAQGWILSQGMNPYEVAMGSVPSPYANGIYITWRSTTAVYPPFTLLLQQAVVEAAGAHQWWGVVGMRAIALLGLAIMGAGAVLLARDLGLSPRLALWGAVMNPLTLVQLIGGAHNDTVMIGLVLIALWLARRRHGLVWGAITVGVAAMFKQPAVLAGLGVVVASLPPELRTRPVRWLPIAGRAVIGGLIGGATFVVLSLASGLGFGWTAKTGGSPSLVINHSPLSWVAQAVLLQGVSRATVDRVLTVVTTLATVAVIVWCVRRWTPERPVMLTAGALLAFGLLGAAIQPWYPLWGGSLLAVAGVSRRTERLACAGVLLLLISGTLQARNVVTGVLIATCVAVAWYVLMNRLARRRTRALATP